MKKPSAFSEAETSGSSDKKVEEIEILWKLGKKREASRLLDFLIKANPDRRRVLELAGSLYLEQGKTRKAREILRRLEALGEKSEALEALRGNLFIQEERWKEAQEVFGNLYAREPGQREYAKSYARVLAARRRWKEAKKIYSDLFREEAYRRELQWDYRNMAEEMASSLDTSFQYFHRPTTQRDYVLAQKGSFWVNPWLRFGTGLTEEYYKKKGIVDESRIHHFLMSHAFEGQLYCSELFSFLGRWQTTYAKKDDFNEMFLAANFDKKPFRSTVEYAFNHLARDPVEAISKEGRIDTLRMTQEVTLFDRLTGGNLFQIEWFRMPGRNNPVNGSGNLGNKVSDDAYVNLMLWRKPYLSMNYHYRTGHWDQKFSGADTVIGYLAGEIANYGGFYAEYPVGKYLQLIASVTRGCDRKRDVNYLYWYYESRVWIKDYWKVGFSYEYDRGDSGTAGRGDTQVMTTKMDFYF